MSSPRVIPIPQYAHNEIRLLMERVNWTPDGIAQIGAQLLVQIERVRKSKEARFWDVVRYISPEVKKLTGNLKFDIASMCVEETDENDKPTGRSVEIPEGERRGILILLDDIDTATGSSKHVGAVLTGLRQDSEVSYSKLMASLGRYIPEVATGAWDVDMERMVVVEHLEPPEDENLSETIVEPK